MIAILKVMFASFFNTALDSLSAATDSTLLLLAARTKKQVIGFRDEQREKSRMESHVGVHVQGSVTACVQKPYRFPRMH